ncbi:hypothetical protein [Mesorhizobium sp. CAU 1741]|uniref:hypothetical protein n=1 Tax=Mesorhizobium sp. CAU 1741 TaxID=3140366 RepID=UPI00325AA2A9
MVKALFRLLSMITLSVAVIMAVLDATRSIAAEAIVWTPLGETWEAVSPSTLAGLESTIRQGLPPFVWDPVVTGLLGLPGFAVVLAIAVIFGFAGRRRTRVSNRFAAQ